MAKNFVYADGDTLQVVAPGGGVVSGGVVVIGALIGIALVTAAAGEEFALRVKGVVEVPKDAIVLAVGDAVDWDGAKVIAEVAGDRMGIVVEAAAMGDANAKILLNVQGT